MAIDSDSSAPPDLAPVAGEQGGPPPRSAIVRPRVIVALVAALAALGVVLALTIHGGKAHLPNNATAHSSPSFEGAVLSPARPAPPLHLNNYLGDPVNLAHYRGHPVLVTFLYTHCPDVCPLITANLHNTVRQLGPQAAGLRIVAVSVDPRGDNRTSVASFLHKFGMTGQIKYLIGNAHQLGASWQAWNVGSQRDAGHPEFVAHSALIYGIGASGNVLTIYPANFKPQMIEHDLPILARS